MRCRFLRKVARASYCSLNVSTYRQSVQDRKCSYNVRMALHVTVNFLESYREYLTTMFVRDSKS